MGKRKAVAIAKENFSNLYGTVFGPEMQEADDAGSSSAATGSSVVVWSS